MPTSNERHETPLEHFRKNREENAGRKDRMKERIERDFRRGTADIEVNRERAKRGQ